MEISEKQTLDLSTPQNRAYLWKVGLILSTVLLIIPIYYAVTNYSNFTEDSEFRRLILLKGVAQVVMRFVNSVAILWSLTICLKHFAGAKGKAAWPRLWSWLLLFGGLSAVLYVLLASGIEWYLNQSMFPGQSVSWASFLEGYYSFYFVMLLGMATGMLLLRQAWAAWAAFIGALLLMFILNILAQALGIPGGVDFSTVLIWVQGLVIDLVGLVGFSVGLYYAMKRRSEAWIERRASAEDPPMVYTPWVLLGLYILNMFWVHWEFTLSFNDAQAVFLVRFLVMQVLLVAALSLWRFPTVRTYHRWRGVFVVLLLLSVIGVALQFFEGQFTTGWLLSRGISLVAYVVLSILLTGDRDRIEKASLATVSEAKES